MKRHLHIPNFSVSEKNLDFANNYVYKKIQNLTVRQKLVELSQFTLLTSRVRLEVFQKKTGLPFKPFLEVEKLSIL